VRAAQGTLNTPSRGGVAQAPPVGQPEVSPGGQRSPNASRHRLLTSGAPTRPEVAVFKALRSAAEESTTATDEHPERARSGAFHQASAETKGLSLEQIERQLA